MCYGTSRVSSSFSWRFPLGMQAGVSAILAAGSPFLPHSPRWLRHVGRGVEADATWIKLGVSAADAEKTEETANRVEMRREGWLKEAQQLWNKDVRKRTALGVFLMAMQQVGTTASQSRAGSFPHLESFLKASGIDGVLYVSGYPLSGLLHEPNMNSIVRTGPLLSSGSPGNHSILHRLRSIRSRKRRMHNPRPTLRRHL